MLVSLPCWVGSPPTSGLVASPRPTAASLCQASLCSSPLLQPLLLALAAALEVSPGSAHLPGALQQRDLGAGCPQSGLAGPALTSHRVQPTGSTHTSDSWPLPSLQSPVPARPCSGGIPPFFKPSPKSSSSPELAQTTLCGPQAPLTSLPPLLLSLSLARAPGGQETSNHSQTFPRQAAAGKTRSHPHP